jgi:uncharacterized protein (DUF4415 family)
MCGDTVIYSHQKKIYKRRYRCCSGIKYLSPCGNKTIYADIVEEEAIKILGKIMEYPNFTDDLLKELEREVIEYDPLISAQITRCKTQYQLNRKRIETFIREAIDPLKNIEPELINKVHEEIKKDQEMIEREMERLKKKVTVQIDKDVMDKFTKMMHSFRDYFGRASTTRQKKGIVRTAIEKIIISHGKIKEIILKDSFKTLLEELETNGKEESRVHLHLRLSNECA